ncbi:unnamed protein product [Mytilus edulis]|uniref:RRM domain-containing protein n=1 Tax=Mytilus edulis TaxID=6550 RepID=A0A8S3UKG4_MYTED|nr:unnamed protein product [Mytilus edulis]
MQIADENYLLRPCDIPQDRFQEESSSDSFDIAGATNQPEEAIHQSEGATNVPSKYNDIYHTESMPMPGPTFPQQPQGDQGQSYCPYPAQRSGQGYPYNNPNQLLPYGGHSSQPVFKRPPSHLDLKIPQFDNEMNRPLPDEKVPKIGYPYGPGFLNQHALGEYNPNEPGAYMPQGHCSHSFYGHLEQNVSEKKGTDDVPGPSVQPYPYYPQFFQGYHGYPVNPHYPYPRDGDMGTPGPGLGQNPHPPVDLDHLNIKSPIHKPFVDTLVQNPEKTYKDSSDRSFKPVGSNNDERRDFESIESGRVTECYQETSSTNKEEKKDDSEQSIKMIKVSNIPTGSSEYSFRYYFENKRKSGGGDIADLDYDEDSHTAIITFEEEDAVEAVMSKTHRFDEQTLDVKRYVKPPPLQYVPKYKDKVFITNISPKTSKDGLENFLELKSKCIPEEIIFGEAESTAIVTFEQPPDMEQLQTVCMRRQLDGSHLSIHTVPITDCIVVTGYKDNTSSDTMEYYFDNKRRSGVEGVREVKLVEDDGKFLVYFIDPESALQVCNRQHKLEGRILKVQVYYECLDQDA